MIRHLQAEINARYHAGRAAQARRSLRNWIPGASAVNRLQSLRDGIRLCCLQLANAIAVRPYMQKLGRDDSISFEDFVTESFAHATESDDAETVTTRFGRDTYAGP
jgi:hypothetical protein